MTSLLESSRWQRALRLFLTSVLISFWPAGDKANLLRALRSQTVESQNSALTPLEREIERQRQRLQSAEIEERRDALMRLGNLKRPAASRVAASALNDPAPIVRVTAAHATVHLPPDEAAALLIPLLEDRVEFVRQEAAYALGKTRSRAAVKPLANALTVDKKNSVRGAAAVALGQIGDESAVVSLAQVLGVASGPPEKAPANSRSKKRKIKTRDNDFVLRAAARSLGLIHSRAGVPALIGVLSNEANYGDLRREAAAALGLIGDQSAVPALQAALGSEDPYLSGIAYESLRKLGVRKE